MLGKTIIGYRNNNLWTRIFHVCPHSIGETCFLFVKKINFGKSQSRHLFYFYFKGKIK